MPFTTQLTPYKKPPRPFRRFKPRQQLTSRQCHRQILRKSRLLGPEAQLSPAPAVVGVFSPDVDVQTRPLAALLPGNLNLTLMVLHQTHVLFTGTTENLLTAAWTPKFALGNNIRHHDTEGAC